MKKDEEYEVWDHRVDIVYKLKDHSNKKYPKSEFAKDLVIEIFDKLNHDPIEVLHDMQVYYETQMKQYELEVIKDFISYITLAENYDSIRKGKR